VTPAPDAYAELHFQLIERFGRFPHRNAALARVTTNEEQTYLDRGRETFAQG
jgi:uncharacterized protein (DUF924 family)